MYQLAKTVAKTTPYILLATIVLLLLPKHGYSQVPRYELRGSNPFIKAIHRLKNGHQTTITLATPEGQVRLRLRKESVLKSIPYAEDANRYQNRNTQMRFLRGNALNRQRNSFSEVTATMYGGKLLTFFYGPQRGRLFRAEIDASGKVSLLHLPTTVQITCAHDIQRSALQRNTVQKISRPTIHSHFGTLTTKRLTISLDLDRAWLATYKNNALAEALSAYYAASTILRRQLRVHLSLRGVHQYKKQSEPYTSDSPFTLLAQFRAAAFHQSTLPASDLKLLLTGKTEDDTVGISYIGSACTTYGAVVVWRFRRKFTPYLLVHELGHQLGANHPEEIDAAEPPSFMSPYILSTTTQFSNFSKQEIATFFSDNSACGR